MAKHFSGKELRKLMGDLGFTPAELAVALQISISTLYKIFREDSRVHLNVRNRVGEIATSLKERRKASA